MPHYTIDTDNVEYAVKGDGEVSFTCLKEAQAEAHKALPCPRIDSDTGKTQIASGSQVQMWIRADVNNVISNDAQRAVGVLEDQA